MRRAASTAERPPRSFWFDPRFAIGIGLVVASIAGVVALVSSADRTVQVWAARDALSAGDTVVADDLVLRDVRLGAADDLYLVEDGLPAGGLVLARTVAAGELLPESALGSRDSTRLAAVVVPIRGQLAQSVVAGSVVDVWSAKENEEGVFGPPAVLVSSATVVRVLEDDGLIVDGTAAGVEVLVPRARIASVLEGIANDDSMSLVPVTMPVAG